VGRSLRAGLLILLIAAVCAAAVWGAIWYRSRALTAAAMLKRLPVSSALVVYVDFAALRASGILNSFENAQVPEDPEYGDFVRKTKFDYKQDLDTALASFTPSGKFLLLKGRFDWKTLRAYTESENGSCYNSLCRMAGSTPERRISFFPVQSNLMALAVSDDESAAVRMQSSTAGPNPEVPEAPVWMSIAPALLKSGDLPAATRPFARSVERAESVVLAFAPDGGRVMAKLTVRCRSGEDAAELASQLTRTTALLREAIERERRALNAADLTGVLTAGAFHSEGARVLGTWPIERRFLDGVLAGK
jgi:hypothetical protein